jgi:hypothetical protein
VDKRNGRTCVVKGYSRVTLKARQLANVQREVALLRFFWDAGWVPAGHGNA